ncbi:MAG: 4-(cytidine 5'-diphospho)-2-C-methyl-D-erythritol kinase [Candidatus Latescibacterota bacterium]
MHNQQDNKIFAIARAKVNLALKVLYKRGDGYHEIETILQSVDLFDELNIEFTQDGRIAITCTDPDIPTDDKNICWKAVLGMRQMVPGLGARIHIRKQIPHSAGLGGGSSDAGAVIMAANEVFDLNLPAKKLEQVAISVGSDVPFMLYGGTMLGRGRGEKLTRLENLKKCYFLIVKPPVDISTSWVYENINFRLTRGRYRLNLKQVNTILAHFPKIAMSFKNDLEDVVCPAFPQISGILDRLLSCDPSFAAMSGSGSAVFAIFENEGKASGLADRFSMRGCFTTVVEPSLRAVDLCPA